jgi:hypothetical protein
MAQIGWISGLLTAVTLFAAPAGATMAGKLSATIAGPEEVVFNPRVDACDGYDVPDISPRLYRDDRGNIRMYTLHFENRALIGKSLDSLKIDCRIVFRGNRSGNPAQYDDKSWIAATWTPDGRTIHGLIHHEFQANSHPGRCVYADYMPCWYNTVLAVKSGNRGEKFGKAGRAVVASSPFEQHIGQGRHRGFFNPSNIVSDGVWHYMMASTTGWSGQPSGVCLFRTDNIADPSRWRAWSGRGFDVRFGDPYRGDSTPGQTCQTLPPFPAPVGSITRHTPSGQWIAVFQAAADRKNFPTSGIYIAASRDLLSWSAPRRVMETKTLYDSPCGAPVLNSYPTLIDRDAKTRNFEDIGDTPELYLSRMRIDGCKHTSDRTLVRMKLRLAVE